MTKRKFKSIAKAYKDAIKRGFLTEDAYAPNYTGNYKYMGSIDGQDIFKNRITEKLIF